MTHILRDCAMRTNLHLTNEKFAVHRTLYLLVKTKYESKRRKEELSGLTVYPMRSSSNNVSRALTYRTIGTGLEVAIGGWLVA